MRFRICAYWVMITACIGLCASLSSAGESEAADSTRWTRTGWGGGGFYYAVAFHPMKDGVIYVGGDVLGCYKTEDHGRNWRMINNGIAGYGVFSLAVDSSNVDTVYAATTNGLCKSTDAGETWTLLPMTGPGELQITGKKTRSIRSVVVDPDNGNIVYAGSPVGGVYKSTDAGRTWVVAYEKPQNSVASEAIHVQFGKINGEWFGGVWLNLAIPSDVNADACNALGLKLKGDGTPPRNAYFKIHTTSGGIYRSKDLRDIFTNAQWDTVLLNNDNVTLDPSFLKDHPEKAANMPPTPEWSTVKRLDLGCVGPLPTDASSVEIANIFLALSDQETESAANPVQSQSQVVVRDFSKNKNVGLYGNVKIVKPNPAGVYSVAVSDHDPNVVAAATNNSGVVMSNDAGYSWRSLDTPTQASSVVFPKSDANIVYATFHRDGIARSDDRGKTWTDITPSSDQATSYIEIEVSPINANQVYAIGKRGWGGVVLSSTDGGKSWLATSEIRVDAESGNPTLPGEVARGVAALSNPRNLAINPQNPEQLFIAGNWRLCISDDAGATWIERSRGADISCITDIEFRNGRTYVTAMDQGTLVSDDDGVSWRQLWPLKWTDEISGHNWRLEVLDNGEGGDRIIATCSPWNQKFPNRVILSNDGGQSFEIITEGLPDYVPTANTMWGRSYLRALAVDPQNSDILYAGMDGDPTNGKSGGGVFKSEDGGESWTQLPNQPKSRRMFFGMVVDPTDSNRLYVGAGGSGAGLYRSEDGGNSWTNVFNRDGWIFNVYVAADGSVYCPGKNLWRSRDHGKTWERLTNFSSSTNRVVFGVQVDPDHPDTIWVSQITWDLSANGAVWKTTDGGILWTDITGDLPYVKPLVLRFNPETRELWAGYVGLYKLKQ